MSAQQLIQKRNSIQSPSIILARKTLEKEILASIPAGTEVYFHIAIANIDVRKESITYCERLNLKPYTVCHPTAVISPTAKIGKGVFVGPLAVVSSHAVIDDYCLVHLHASRSHDARVGRFNSILPGARISGNAHLGENCLVGSNAFIAAGVRVGDDSQIDALTYVSRDVPPNMLVSARSKLPVPRLHRS